MAACSAHLRRDAAAAAADDAAVPPVAVAACGEAASVAARPAIAVRSTCAAAASSEWAACAASSSRLLDTLRAAAPAAGRRALAGTAASSVASGQVHNIDGVAMAAGCRRYAAYQREVAAAAVAFDRPAVGLAAEHKHRDTACNSPRKGSGSGSPGAAEGLRLPQVRVVAGQGMKVDPPAPTLPVRVLLVGARRQTKDRMDVSRG